MLEMNIACVAGSLTQVKLSSIKFVLTKTEQIREETTLCR